MTCSDYFLECDIAAAEFTPLAGPCHETLAGSRQISISLEFQMLTLVTLLSLVLLTFACAQTW
jgi:hypothetical protein